MDTVTELNPLHQTIAETLSELGRPELPCRITTLLIQDGHYLGQRFVFDEVQAVWLIAENVVQFYDENGQMLKSVHVGTVEELRKAA